MIDVIQIHEYILSIRLLILLLTLLLIIGMTMLVFIITSKNSTIRKVVVTSEMTMSIKNSSNDVEHDFFMILMK